MVVHLLYHMVLRMDDFRVQHLDLMMVIQMVYYLVLLLYHIHSVQKIVLY